MAGRSKIYRGAKINKKEPVTCEESAQSPKPSLLQCTNDGLCANCGASYLLVQVSVQDAVSPFPRESTGSVASTGQAVAPAPAQTAVGGLTSNVAATLAYVLVLITGDHLSRAGAIEE